MKIDNAILASPFKALDQLHSYRSRGRAIHCTLGGIWIVRVCRRFIGWGWDTSGEVVAWSRDGLRWHGEQP